MKGGLAIKCSNFPFRSNPETKDPGHRALTPTLMTETGGQVSRTGPLKSGSRVDLGVDVIVLQVRERKGRRRRR